MAWDGYITNLMKPDQQEKMFIIDAAIVGTDLSGTHSPVWGSYAEGTLKNITIEEVKVLISSDRSPMFSNGVTLAGCRYTVLSDNLLVEGDHTLNIKAKTQPPCSVTIQKTLKSLVIVVGEAAAPGGKVRCRCNETAEYLVGMKY